MQGGCTVLKEKVCCKIYRGNIIAVDIFCCFCFHCFIPTTQIAAQKCCMKSDDQDCSVINFKDTQLHMCLFVYFLITANIPSLTIWLIVLSPMIFSPQLHHRFLWCHLYRERANNKLFKSFLKQNSKHFAVHFVTNFVTLRKIMEGKWRGKRENQRHRFANCSAVTDKCKCGTNTNYQFHLFFQMSKNRELRMFWCQKFNINNIKQTRYFDPRPQVHRKPTGQN